MNQILQNVVFTLFLTTTFLIYSLSVVAVNKSLSVVAVNKNCFDQVKFEFAFIAIATAKSSELNLW